MGGIGPRRRGVVLAAALVAVLAAGGCGGGSGGHDSAAEQPVTGVEGGTDRGGPAAADAQAGAGQPGTAAGGAPADLRVDQRAIVYTGSMRVQVQDVDRAARDAIALTTTAGGFVGGDQRRSADGDATAELTLRVPAAKFTTVVDEIAKLGTRQRQEISTEDVTEETVDLDARIATQRARVENGRRLLARATSITDLVSLENELARREADLASLEAKKRRLADLTALSTITVSLVGPEARPVDGEERVGFLAGLDAGWKVFLASLTVLLTVLGALLPWLVTVGVPVGLLVWLVRRRRPQPALVAAMPATATAGPATATAAPETAGQGVGNPGGISSPPPVPGARSAP
ncbi:DUF4349 domain-containing protein [Micromonospora sp. WMMC415]|uniref:DUF4349 domain-containing protein n=1 Tax=Micromonospora sp. WMMC415 TaxID=2675222 RepID=UPI0012B44438|nr:DUF4349 domain-containing protein [Micromonospora sp. WMMC415]QGN45466.1 DUF4349 domain-containing protein [Micromonospora sp. WMMC415]